MLNSEQNPERSVATDDHLSYYRWLHHHYWTM